MPTPETRKIIETYQIVPPGIDRKVCNLEINLNDSGMPTDIYIFRGTVRIGPYGVQDVRRLAREILCITDKFVIETD